MWPRAGAAALVVAVTALLVVLGAGAASAAPELSLLPASGPPGTEITVFGAGFAPGDVEIRWRSLSGALLETASGPDFAVKVVVPDEAPSSYPIVAVVREGSGVSTSNTSFQVTPGSTTTTVETTVPTVPTTSPAPLPTGGAEVVRGGGVGGGIDPGMPDTADPALPVSPDPTVAPPLRAGAATATTTATSATATTPATALPGAPPAEAAIGPNGSATTTPGLPAGAGTSVPGDGEAGRAIGPASASQSAGAVRSPALLVGGLVLALAGGVIMLVRNRHQLRS